MSFLNCSRLSKLVKLKPIHGFYQYRKITNKIPVLRKLCYCRSYSAINTLRSLFTTPVSLRNEDEEEDERTQYENLVKRAFRTAESGHVVLVIQPYIKWGRGKKTLTTPDYQLEESVALIESLQNWNVAATAKVSMLSFRTSKFFGKGKLEELKTIVKKNNLISAVFVSVNMLNRPQHEFLESEFNVTVYDRYNIVVQIFRAHAVSKEAKLQVAMAEIPFMWYYIKGTEGKGGGAIGSIGGSGETTLELKKRLLTVQEQKIKKELKKLQIHRALIRSQRQELEFPVVAVVGYTNAGKTSLIKALTQEEKLKPRNQLFATLDVTVHEGVLPSNIRVLYIDTIGFISDIPTVLIEPFKVTLEDAIQSDLIIHVQDVSNPDMVSQSQHVTETLKSLNVDEKLMQSIITVGNKVDKITDNKNDLLKDLLPISCRTGLGLHSLRNQIQTILLRNTGRMSIRIRVGSGGEEYQWLCHETSVFSITPDPSDIQFAFMDVIITETNLSKFKHKFIYSSK